MSIFENKNNLSKAVVLLRVNQLDPLAEVYVRVGIVPYIEVDNSTLGDDELETLFSQPETTEETDYFANKTIDEQALKDAYQNMIARLEQIQNAGTIPFTQAGFNQVVQAGKDEALYIERIMKVLKTLFT